MAEHTGDGNGKKLDNDDRREIPRRQEGKQTHFDVCRSSIHGFGVFAFKDYQESEIVVSSRPLLTRSSQTSLDGKMMNPTFEDWMENIRRLSIEDKLALISAVNSYSTAKWLEGKPHQMWSWKYQPPRGDATAEAKIFEGTEEDIKAAESFETNLPYNCHTQFDRDFAETPNIEAVLRLWDVFFYYRYINATNTTK